MLDSDSEEVFVAEHDTSKPPSFREALGKLPFNVQVPRSHLGELMKSGPCSSRMAEQRRHVRFHHFKQGILGYQQSLSPIRRLQALHLVLITNISKSGIGILHSEQLYPREHFFLWIEDRGILRVDVARCRKVNENCFDVGLLCPQLAHLLNEREFLR